MKEKRILFLTTSIGSGHRRAGEAIQEALFEVSPEPLKIRTDTYFDYFTPVAERMALKIYVRTIQSMRQILKYLYSYQKKNPDRNSIKHFLNIPLVKKHEEAIKNFRPDIVVCTQALSCRFVSILKTNRKIFTPLMAVITDFDSHPYWFSKYVDKFIVPTGEIKEEFINYGIKADKIHDFGIPIHPYFSKTQNRKILRTKLGMEKDLPVILIMGGGWGLGPIKKIVLHLNDSGMVFQLIVVTGKNKTLKKKLDKILSELKIPVKIYGYVNNIDEVMEISDIAITKPGGLTTAELLAKGLPAILLDVIPGQEEANSEYLITEKAAYRIEKMSQLKDTIQRLLKNPAELAQMRIKAKTIAKPFAAVDTAKLIMDTINEHAIYSQIYFERNNDHRKYEKDFIAVSL